jgi:small subunit ribosomal protein S1
MDTTAIHAAASDEAGSAAARIRERMAQSSLAIDTNNPVTTSQPVSSRRAAGVEIPGADDLDPTLEAEIQSAMSSDQTAPTTLVAEPEETPAAEGEPRKQVGSGTKLRATVQAVHGGEVFLEAGLRNNIVVPVTQFPQDKIPAVGDALDVIIDSADGDGLIKGRIPRARHRARGDWDALAVGQVVDCVVQAVNKGGLQVGVSSLRAFLPASQVELGFAGNLEGYVGQKLTVQITEVNPKKRNLVVSRRALLQAERSEGEGAFWAAAEVGQDYKGTVKTLKDYGAFVNIGPVDGFLHIGEISWSRINHPKDVLTEGQTIDVRILKLDVEKKRISLGMKQLAQNPWASATEKYSTGRTVNGRVTRTTDFGAFVELEPGLEGMVHISELAWRRVGAVTDILKAGDSHDFQVVEVDPKRKRVSLSLKALEKKPEPPAPPAGKGPAESAPAPAESRRQRNPNLRGGTGTGSGGPGLFGNPSDFS